jgi:hypothetical protein
LLSSCLLITKKFCINNGRYQCNITREPFRRMAYLKGSRWSTNLLRCLLQCLCKPPRLLCCIGK